MAQVAERPGREGVNGFAFLPALTDTPCWQKSWICLACLRLVARGIRLVLRPLL